MGRRIHPPLVAASARRPWPLFGAAASGPPLLGASLGLARRLCLRAARSAVPGVPPPPSLGGLARPLPAGPPPPLRRLRRPGASSRALVCGLALRASAGSCRRPWASPGLAWPSGRVVAGRSSLRPPFGAAAWRPCPRSSGPRRCGRATPAPFNAPRRGPRGFFAVLLKQDSWYRTGVLTKSLTLKRGYAKLSLRIAAKNRPNG